MSPATWFITCLKSSLLSTGGFGNVPILHDELLVRHLATQQQFVESLAIGQVSPGPNGLWVVCLGYFLGGIPGAMLALVAVSLPPLLILVVKKLYERHRSNRLVEGFMTGLEVAVTAIFLSVMIEFLASAPKTWLTVVLATSALLLALFKRMPIAAIIVLSGIAAWAAQSGFSAPIPRS